MKPTKIRAVDMVRRIRDSQARSLSRKSSAQVVAFFRAAGDAAVADANSRCKVKRRCASWRRIAPCTYKVVRLTIRSG